jgi:hypothetical protein
MLAFGFLFVVLEVVFTIVIQWTYKPAPILPRYPIVDEILGGLLGVVQGLMIVGAGIAILDSFFRLPIGIGAQQIQVLKDLSNAVDASGTATVFRETLTPIFVALVGPLLPSDLHSLYPR